MLPPHSLIQGRCLLDFQADGIFLCPVLQGASFINHFISFYIWVFIPRHNTYCSKGWEELNEGDERCFPEVFHGFLIFCNWQILLTEMFFYKLDENSCILNENAAQPRRSTYTKPSFDHLHPKLLSHYWFRRFEGHTWHGIAPQLTALTAPVTDTRRGINGLVSMRWVFLGAVDVPVHAKSRIRARQTGAFWSDGCLPAQEGDKWRMLPAECTHISNSITLSQQRNSRCQSAAAIYVNTRKSANISRRSHAVCYLCTFCIGAPCTPPYLGCVCVWHLAFCVFLLWR